MQTDKAAALPRKLASIRSMKRKEPKVVEGPKKMIILKGSKTNAKVSSFLSEMHQLRPGSAYFSKHHELFPFDDFTGMQKFVEKTDSSLFLFGSSSKKKPGRLIFGRAFNYKLLDMAELALTEFVSMSEFSNSVPLNASAVLFFQGEQWDSQPQLTHLRKILTDFFNQNQKSTALDPRQLKLLISFSTLESKILLRTYSIQCEVKGIRSLDNIDCKLGLEEIGPHADFEFVRNREADTQLWKKAHEVPQVLKKTKTNFERDSLGNKRGRVFVDKQDLEQLPIRKRKELKALRKQKEAEQQNAQAEMQ